MYLDSNKSNKTVRTTLYQDQSFSLFEMEVVHTPIVQRLYNLKQLGFADKVFPDAVHSRFNHVLGVAHIADCIVDGISRQLDGADQTLAYFDVETGVKVESTTAQLRERMEASRRGIRLLALLHDLTHSAYGHTLEDEVRVFTEKHDDPVRQRAFLDALVAQLITIWHAELTGERIDSDEIDALSDLIVDKDKILTRARKFASYLDKDRVKQLANDLHDLELASVALNYLEWSHGKEHPDESALLVTEVRRRLYRRARATDFVPHRDAYMLDVVGNTICADLLDYARRDAKNSGLMLRFDIRLLKYMCLVTAEGEYSPDGNPAIRVATQYFTDKMRYDVLSEMSAILKARYLIYERILFHPAKCAAGALLGTAVGLLGFSSPPRWVQVLGDQEFLAVLRKLTSVLNAALLGIDESRDEPIDRLVAEVLQETLGEAEKKWSELALDCVNHVLQLEPFIDKAGLTERVAAARYLLWKLEARRHPQLFFRLRLSSVKNFDDEANVPLIIKNYKDPANRYALERQVERQAGLDIGAVTIHCPPEKPGVKIARALVVGTNWRMPRFLREVADKAPPALSAELMPYQKELRAIEDMYDSIWQFHAFIDSDQVGKAKLAEYLLGVAVDEVNDPLLAVGIDNADGFWSELFSEEQKSKFLADELPAIVKMVDENPSLRHRFREAEDFPALVDEVIQKVRDEGSATYIDPAKDI